MQYTAIFTAEKMMTKCDIVKKLTTIQCKKFKASHDEIYGYLQLAYHLNDFVKLVSIYPDIRIFLGSKDILSELE